MKTKQYIYKVVKVNDQGQYTSLYSFHGHFTVYKKGIWINADELPFFCFPNYDSANQYFRDMKKMWTNTKFSVIKCEVKEIVKNPNLLNDCPYDTVFTNSLKVIRHY
jgi:hypothetical protein